MAVVGSSIPTRMGRRITTQWGIITIPGGITVVSHIRLI